MLKKIFKGYSIAEALATMAIIGVIFVMVAPGVVGKKPKIASFVHSFSKHGVYTCDSGTCNFDLPEGVKDIYVIAVGAGGGGAGANCGEEGETREGDATKDLDGVYEYVPNRTLYISGSGAGGGSTQLTGDCDYYKPADTFSTKNEAGGHDYECQVWYSKRLHRDYKETQHVRECTHRYWENVNHPYRAWVKHYRDKEVEDKTNCLERPLIKDGELCVTVDGVQKCTDNMVPDMTRCNKYGTKTIKEEYETYDLLDNWYYEWVYRTEQCNYAQDGLDPWWYSHDQKGSDYITKYIRYCDRNKPLQADCLPSYQNNNWGGGVHIGNQTLWEEWVEDIHQRETERVGRADACTISWLHKPEVGRSNRYCNSAVFGGRGGNGEKYYRRTCPVPGNAKCIKYREAHTTPSNCTKAQIDERGVSDGCKEVFYTKPIHAWDKYFQALWLKCNAWEIQSKLEAEGKCGHEYGKWNCYTPHTGPVSKKCIEWDNSAKTIAYTIGQPGRAGRPNGSAARNTVLNRPTSAAAGIPQFGQMTIEGGEAGPRNRHGNTGGKYTGGREGGRHTGMSEEYSAIPQYHTQDGKPGWLGFAVKYINVGQGGRAGETKAGYFKNVEGPVVITVGSGGAGGVGGNGHSGGNTLVKAKKGGFNTFYDVGSGEENPTGGTSTGGSSTIDKGPGDGTLFNAVGGPGGTQSKYYETCTTSGGESFDLESNEYTGGGGYPSKFEGYGAGGDGAGGRVPDCPTTTGKSGQGGGVIIFF